jgi:hypothetical protein
MQDKDVKGSFARSSLRRTVVATAPRVVARLPG